MPSFANLDGTLNHAFQPGKEHPEACGYVVHQSESGWTEYCSFPVEKHGFQVIESLTLEDLLYAWTFNWQTVHPSRDIRNPPKVIGTDARDRLKKTKAEIERRLNPTNKETPMELKLSDVTVKDLLVLYSDNMRLINTSINRQTVDQARKNLEAVRSELESRIGKGAPQEVQLRWRITVTEVKEPSSLFFVGQDRDYDSPEEMRADAKLIKKWHPFVTFTTQKVVKYVHEKVEELA